MRWAIGLCVLSVCVGCSWHRLTAWQTDRALWQDAIRVNPTSTRAHVNVQRALVREGQWIAAIEECDRIRALPVDPRGASVVRSVCVP